MKPFLHSAFSNEAQFRLDFVRPFLVRQGFLFVEETHGSGELGQDFIFSELHPFFGYKTYAAVIKHARVVNSGRSVRDIIVQVNQAFEKPVRRLAQPRESHVSSVLVLNSGTITEHARTEIWNSLERKVYRENVVFHDGHSLDAIETYNASGTALADRQTLVQFANECQMSRDLASYALLHLSNGEARTISFKFSAIENLMDRSYLLKLVGRDAVYELWCTLKIVGCSSVRAAGFEAIYIPEHLPAIVSDCRRVIRLIDDLFDKGIRSAFTEISGKPFKYDDEVL